MCRTGGRRCPDVREHRLAANARKRLKYAMSKGTAMSDTQYANHLGYAYSAIDKMVDDGLETHKVFARTLPGGSLVWDNDRVVIHSQIIDEILGEADLTVVKEGKALFSGGLGGAGKTTVLRGVAGIKTEEYLTLNPDDVKEIMAEKGLIPSVQGLSPMEASPLVHEEASYITARLAEIAMGRKMNIIYDTTMSSYDSVVKKIKRLSDNGYETIDAIFVDIKPEVSLSRSQSRHRHGLNDYVEGKGYGGRLLPTYLIDKQKSSSEGHWSLNSEIFSRLQSENVFNGTSKYDNNVDGREPLRVE